jgi:hypothetical protein
VQRLAAQLVRDGFDDFWIAVADVEDAEPAETINILPSGYVAIRVRTGVGPFDDGAGAMRVVRFTILEESGVDVISEAVDGLMRDPLRVGRRDVGLLDQV